MAKKKPPRYHPVSSTAAKRGLAKTGSGATVIKEDGKRSTTVKERNAIKRKSRKK